MLERHKPECKVLRTNPKKLVTGSEHESDHVREVMECIRRAGLNYKVKTLCLTQVYFKAEGKNVYILEEPMDSKDFQNMLWSCRRVD
ncbi:hypothetical protein AC579_2529 [Pseudocercospora musae]|uniref:Uncharacterized protein n=1 Tax=Pseudocercospora musae TaxID=113226 RepID=A0A139I4F1_9PEZI|nr:hypothetical protein AC579_2529 [Pseudocercospora musae]